MISVKDIHSLTDFKRETKSHLRRLKRTGKPEVLTVNGKAELVVVNAGAFEDMIDTVRGIQRSLDAMDAGEGGPLRKALESIKAQYHRTTRR